MTKITQATSIAEIGAIVCEGLKQAGLDAFLSGGAVVSIYTNNRYESFDLDFVSLSDRTKIKRTMEELGFVQNTSDLKTNLATDGTGAPQICRARPARGTCAIIPPLREELILARSSDFGQSSALRRCGSRDCTKNFLKNHPRRFRAALFRIWVPALAKPPAIASPSAHDQDK